MQFKVGDRVSWAGVTGTIVKDYKFPHPIAATLVVEFDSNIYWPGINQLPHKVEGCFDRQGRLHAWHKEASLILIEPTD